MNNLQIEINGNVVELDQEQLMVALKKDDLVIDVTETPSSASSTQQVKKIENQQRLFGRFVKQNRKSKKRHPGIGRPCPLCQKWLSEKGALVRHLTSVSACPRISSNNVSVEKLCQESQRLAKLAKISKNHSMAEVSSPQHHIPSVVVNVNNNSVVDSTTNSSMTSNNFNMNERPIERYLEEYERSFSNAIFGSSNRSGSTIKKLVNAARNVVSACNYQSISDCFTKDGIEKLKVPFGRPVQFTTKKGMCQGYWEFIQFLEYYDDLPVSENRRALLLNILEKAYKSFSRGISIDVANRRQKLSEAIRNDDLPTYSEVCKVYNYLLEKAISLPDLEGLNFKDFVAFISFSLIKRCAIRPGALSLMKIKDFLSPVFEDNETILVHVKGKKIRNACFPIV